MSVTYEDISFKGYISSLKMFMLCIFIIFGLYFVVFSDASQVTYHKWFYKEWAFPIRWAVIAIFSWLLAGIFILFIWSLFRVPFIIVQRGCVEIGLTRKKFDLANVKEVSHSPYGGWFIYVGKKRYHVPSIFCANRSKLDANMGDLHRIVHERRQSN